MTEIILDHRSKEEKDCSRQEQLSKMSEEERKATESGGKIKWDPIYDFEETWRLWEENLDKTRMNKFILTHFPNSTDFDFVYLLNITELATVIKKHYQLFQKYLGFDFDPLEVVIDIQNEHSLFWNKIFNGEPSDQERICLIGILFGYGLENSYPFSLVFNNHRASASRKFTSYLFNQMTRNVKQKKVKKFSTTSFSIPGFRAFSDQNPTTLKYEKERNEIIKYYKGKDLNQATLQLLYD